MSAEQIMGLLLLGFLTIASLFLAVTYAFADGWEYELVDGWAPGYVTGEANSIALNASDEPFISYQQDNDRELRCAFRGSSGWEIELVDSSAPLEEFIGSSSIAIDSAGNPHIAYSDNPGDRVKYAYRESGNWYVSVVDDSGVGGTVSLCLDSSEHPHIAYFSIIDEYYGDDLIYARWDGTNWQTDIVDYDGIRGRGVSMELDSNDNPRLSYVYEDYILKYAYSDGETWYAGYINIDGKTDCQTSLVLDSSGNPHIAYFDYLNDKVVHVYWNGSDWFDEVVDSSNYTWDTDMVIDDADRLHLVYSGSGDVLHYARRENTGWIIESVGTKTWYNYSLALDSYDKPYIAYIDTYLLALYLAYPVETGIVEDGKTEPNNPTGFALSPPQPNPSPGTAAVSFTLPHSCEVSLGLFDVKGRKIDTLAEGYYRTGEYSIDVGRLSSGVYFYKLEADDFADTKKLVVK